MRILSQVIFFCSVLQIFLLVECKKVNVDEKHSPEMKVDSVYSWLCNMQQDNGLLLSGENCEYASLYDNALAALVFSSYGDFSKAEKIFDFLEGRMSSEFMQDPGGFGQLRMANGTPVDNRPRRWLGDNAWLLIALNNYHHLANNMKYQNLATAINNWIISLQDTDGGVWGGYDEKGNLISKITEGKIDAYNAISGYAAFHQKLLAYFYKVRWNQTDKLLIV